ncbi:hypothetical protein L249_7489 [Ophiocordyceps polyrhachis-furcata BCC 54312]|uniref:THUMP domain-containing protein n=1 Tax=Ophiocordyceps polyrhachis-furcata BCC 54312 TaxID=1330021 RepID=A0A367LAT2_9HYPO|nr:hypothetical protein L249_7489 [Ophiocordyceps polyrhachis-furcata BCC 54312]
MAGGASKRKQGPGGAMGGESVGKRSKGGSRGRWKTPHQQAKTTETDGVLDVGDGGIWVTFVRGMQAKAVREFRALCGDYCESMYGMRPADDTTSEDEAADEKAIEKSIEDELSSLREKHKSSKPKEPFCPVLTGLDCLFFMKLSKPIDPAAMARKMCEDARDCPQPRQRKCRYINRLTPVTDTDRATDKGIVRVAHRVLAPFFSLQGIADGEAQGVEAASSPPCTYAIRYNIRNHTAFKSDAVIKMIASLIHERHKVSLGKPDKVILVEIFQLFCGVSVVDGKEWEALKRYNVNTLYEMSRPETGTEEAAKGPAGDGRQS